MRTDTYVTRNEAAEFSGASAATINKAVEQRAVRTKRLRAGSAIDARDVGALSVFAALPFGLPIEMKRAMAAWLRTAPLGAEFDLASQRLATGERAPIVELPVSDALVVRKSEALVAAIARALRYVELRERFLEINPEVQAGEPVIRGTRVPIRGLAKQIAAGEDESVLREDYDYIDPEAFGFAVVWAKANPRRGRPARPWANGERGAEPPRRSQILASRRQATLPT